MVLDYITLEKDIAKINVDEPKSAKEIKEDKRMDRQIQKYKKYKELYGDLDESQYENADMKQKEHVHPTLKNHDFINQMIIEHSLTSEGKGLFYLKD